MKKVISIFLFGTLAVGCGNSNDSKATSTKDSSTISADTSSSSTPTVANQKGLELIGASDCTTCHALKEKKIGPAYSDVAEKYRNVPHALDTLVLKVMKGGSGNWGTVPMTGHPALKESDVKEMVGYILAMKK